MSLLKRGLVVSAAVIGLAVVAGCAYFGKVLDDPEVRILGLENVMSAPEQMRLTARLEIVNPARVTLLVKRIRYELSSGTRPLGSGQLLSVPRVPPLTRQVFDLPLALSSTAWPAVPPGAPVQVRFSGSCTLTEPWTLRPLPFAYRGTLAWVRPPEVEVSGGSLTASGGRLFCRLRNPNRRTLVLQTCEGRLEALGRTWVLSSPPSVTLAPESLEDLVLDLGPVPELAAETAAGRTVPYRVRGEVACTSDQGRVIGVLNASGRAGPDGSFSP